MEGYRFVRNFRGTIVGRQGYDLRGTDPEDSKSCSNDETRERRRPGTDPHYRSVEYKASNHRGREWGRVNVRRIESTRNNY